MGMALAEAMLAARFNTAQRTIVDHYTYVLCGDGCQMEGISMKQLLWQGIWDWETHLDL